MELMKRKIRYSETRFFNLYHLHYYFSKNPEIDGVRKLILDFKNYEEQSVRYFLIEAIEKLQVLDIDSRVLVIRALSSQELVIGDMGSGSLDRLGLCLAAVFDCEYDPAVIYKKRHIIPLKTLGILQRQAVLEGVYSFNADGFERLRRVLIIDDIVTTGSTARAIAAPILKVFPNADIMVFAIGWTPTARQQEYIQEREKNSYILNEPEIIYNTQAKWFDADYEFGETHIAVE